MKGKTKNLLPVGSQAEVVQAAAACTVAEVVQADQKDLCWEAVLLLSSVQDTEAEAAGVLQAEGTD